ncbi:hypothetical protein HF325_005232 [Metschnikowia pulcherrima]|uniref:Uncharacterized protein n=1 Tax=Metschnikowia pulcherrima TaxID=27326 RepID=A0A8H7GNA9_9ASCO|nr:hypothetical protein HF325_005232 [Metschnikowia pulcherrima]
MSSEVVGPHNSKDMNGELKPQSILEPSGNPPYYESKERNRYRVGIWVAGGVVLGSLFVAGIVCLIVFLPRASAPPRFEPH